DKSLHATVQVDAANRAEFDARRAKVWEIFGGHNIDEGNKNPSRYSRIPEVDRTIYDESNGQVIRNVRQQLLAIRLGPSSWAEWQKHAATASSSQATSSGRHISRKLRGASIVDYAERPIDWSKNLLGNRWLSACQGAFFVAPSGHGKSVWV